MPFEVPGRDELKDRLAAVLEVIYLIFNEGYAASSGESIIRPELMEEALRLGRILAELLPDEAEVHGLAALMEFQASRTRARVSVDGEAILLADQDRTRWDAGLIDEGHALVRACLRQGRPGPYQLQAAIQAVHTDALDVSLTDWGQVVALYDQLVQVRPSPVVALNRAVAVSMAAGPAAGLELADRLRGGPLDDYHLLHATRADLLRRLGRSEEAVRAYERARELARNPAERALLERRLRELSA